MDGGWLFPGATADHQQSCETKANSQRRQIVPSKAAGGFELLYLLQTPW